MAAKQPKSYKLWFISAALVFGAAVLFWAISGRNITPAAPRAGRNVLVSDVASGKLDTQPLETLAWVDVIPTVEAVSAQKRFAQDVIAATAKLQHPPALYLRAMLQLAANDAAAAAATFGQIPPDDLPAALLYAPYRLQGGLSSNQTNPFREAMQRAVARDEVPPLIQARVRATEGDFAAALPTYLRTDPAAWTDFDVAQFRLLRLQSPLANDTAAMLQAALKAGRMPKELRPEIIAVLRLPTDKAALEQMKARFLKEMDANPALRNAAITGAVRQLAARQLFVENQHGALLARYQERNPDELTDETILLLTLSAGQQQDAVAFDRWAQELNRRYPTPEVQKWIKQIRPASR